MNEIENLEQKLIEAVQSNNADSFKTLLKNGVKVDDENADKLLEKAIENASWILLYLLLNNGAKIDKENSGKLLEKAVDNNDEVAMYILLEHGAKINKEKSGKLLEKAIEKDNKFIVEDLLKQEVEITWGVVDILFVDLEQVRFEYAAKILRNGYFVGKEGLEMKKRILRGIYNAPDILKMSDIKWIKNDDIEKLKVLESAIIHMIQNEDSLEVITGKMAKDLSLMQLFRVFKKEEIKLLKEELEEIGDSMYSIEKIRNINQQIEEKKKVIKLISRLKEYLNDRRNQYVIEGILSHGKSVHKQKDN